MNSADTPNPPSMSEATSPDGVPPPVPRVRLPLQAAAIIAARVRFVLLIGGLLGLIALWPLLQNYWAKLTRPAPAHGAVSPDTEYWCPMCPGVVSDWPSKCPVCSMTLVRRQKGDMTPLPDGVVARVQLSPYRLQLAGIRTSPVEYRWLEQEITAAGLLETTPWTVATSSLQLTAEVFEPDARALGVGQEGRVFCDACPDETATGRIVEISAASLPAVARRMKVRIENPHGEFRAGVFAAVKFLTPVSRLEASERISLDHWRDRLAVGLAITPLGGFDLATPDGALAVLLDAGVRKSTARAGYTLSVPESAVIDTGTRKVVYVEAMPTMFDAVEVRLGRRCGDFYPVRSGLENGQRVATAGAVLLDAETRLNPSVAASYFGSGSRPSTTTQPSAGSSSSPASPSSEDQQLIAKQKLCPVTGKPLDSMGGPVKVIVDGRAVFICCDGCEERLQKKKDQYLPKLPK